MPASNYSELRFLKAGMGIENLTKPTKLYLALCENALTKVMTGTTISEAGVGAELTYEGYARVELNLAEFELTEGGASTPSVWVNKLALTLKLNTNTTGKSLAKWFAIVDATSAGNVWFYGKLTEELNIVKSITKLEIEAKKLEVTAE